MASRPKQFVIFASDLASAIGRHKYSPRSETLCKLWRRNHEASFCFVHALVLEKEVSRIILNDPESCRKLSISVEDPLWFVDAVRKIVLDCTFQSLYKKILKLVNVRVFEAAREDRILAETSQATKIIDLNFLMENEIKLLCKDETKTVEEAVEEICQRTGVQTNEIQKALKSKLTKDRGTHLEQTAVESFAKSKGIEIKPVATPKLYYKTMEFNGVKWRICGKIDAQTGDQIIEVKNRKNCFMYPIYDFIQLQTYLFLCDKTQGILLERLRGQNRETRCPFDGKFWIEEVTPELYKFVIELTKLIETGKEMLYCNNKSPSPTRKRDLESKIDDPNDMPLISRLPPKMLINSKCMGTSSSVLTDQVDLEIVSEERSSLATCDSNIVKMAGKDSKEKEDEEITNKCTKSLPCSSKLQDKESQSPRTRQTATELPCVVSDDYAEPMSPVY